jgi:hypothetical protein
MFGGGREWARAALQPGRRLIDVSLTYRWDSSAVGRPDVWTDLRRAARRSRGS